MHLSPIFVFQSFPCQIQKETEEVGEKWDDLIRLRSVERVNMKCFFLPILYVAKNQQIKVLKFINIYAAQKSWGKSVCGRDRDTIP